MQAVRPSLGTLTLAKLTPQHLQHLYADRLASLQRLSTGLAIAEPKTPRSRRHVGLTQAAAAALLRTSFLPLLRRADLPRMRFHDLRHSAATLLLGHSRIGTTLDLYSHMTPTMQAEATAAMDEIVARP